MHGLASNLKRYQFIAGRPDRISDEQQANVIKRRWPTFRSNPSEAISCPVVKALVAKALLAERNDFESAASAAQRRETETKDAVAAAKAVAEAAAMAAVSSEGRS